MPPDCTTDQALHAALEHHRAGRLRDAEAIYRQVLAREPNNPDALNLLGFLAHQSNHRREALELIGRAVALQPLAPDFHLNLGVVLAAEGRLDDAIAAWRRTLALRPDDPLASRHLATAMESLGRHAEAADAWRQFCRLEPTSGDAWARLAAALQNMGSIQEAEDVCRHALRLNPACALAHYTLGTVLKDQGRLRAAIASYRRSLVYDPELRLAMSNILYGLHFDPHATPRDIYHEHWLFNAVHARPLEQEVRPHGNDRAPQRRLRIGYVSPDFRAHSTSLFTAPLLAAHDRQQFEIFCYSDVAAPDPITETLRGSADAWRDIVRLTDEQAAAMIRADKIDILVDLALHTAGGRPLLFARKPAPVQVTWLAYPGTSGLTTMDYRITDAWLDPPGLNDGFYFEESVRLPDAMWCYSPVEEGLTVGPLPALEHFSECCNGCPSTLVAAEAATPAVVRYSNVEEGLSPQGRRITFGCLNNFSKANDQVVEMWAGVLAAVAGSRMLVVAPAGECRVRFLQTLLAMGIAEDRIEFVDRRPWLEYMALYHRIDIVLDTFPWNGHTMSLDALWMGVPVVTLCGQTAVSRAGLCFLSHLGLGELVAQTPEQYVAIAARLAGDLPRLAELRASLRGRMLNSPLTDTKRFARNIEGAYRNMWRRWAASSEGAVQE